MNDPANERDSFRRLVYISNNILERKWRLKFFLLTKEQYLLHIDQLEGYALIDTKGIKDISFVHLNVAMNIYHLNKNKLSTININEVSDDAYITISVYSDSKLAQYFSENGILENGSAEVLTSSGINDLPYIPTDQI